VAIIGFDLYMNLTFSTICNIIVKVRKAKPSSFYGKKREILMKKKFLSLLLAGVVAVSMTGCSEAAKEQKETTAVTTTRTTAVEFADDEASSEGGNYISPKGEIVLGEYKGVSAVKTDNGQSTSTDKDWQERVMLKVILNSTYTGLSHADIQDYVDETLEFNKKICDDGGYEFGEYLALTYDMSEDEFEDAVKALLENLKFLRDEALALRKAAADEDAFALANTLEDHIGNYDKNIWFLESMLK